ncbi:MAG: PAS domain S-box protein [Candidatus Auribacterota bacterium]|jgi:PAS domain S-box-containing protein|nr:PAS domain S-box protein [Candidatus Auribacterota bacterium]
MDKRKSSHIESASSILEKRNKAFRILYNTVIEVTQAQDDNIFTILTRNLRELSQATTTAIAVVDRNSMSIALKSVTHDGEDIVIDAHLPAHTAYITPEILKIFSQALIHEVKENEINLATLFPGSCLADMVLSSDSVIYNTTCMRNEDVFAFGLIHFSDNRHIKMKDMADTYLGLASVIIQRAMAVRELNVSKQWFKNLLDCSPVGIMVVDQNRKIVEVNNAAIQMVAGSKESITGKSCKELICNDKSERCPIFDDGKTINQDERLIKHTCGRKVPILKNAIPVEIDNKKYIIETIVDISERKKVEEELKKSEETFKSIFEVANDAIFIHRIPDGRILNVNQKALEMLGYTKEETLNMSVGEISSNETPYTDTEALAYIANAMKSPQLFEWKLRRKNGDVFYTEVNLNKVSILGEDRIMAIIRDISERRKMEEELLKIRKLESVGVLAGGIAHDFNNLLTVIIGNISVAQMDIDPRDESMMSLLDNAAKAALRAKDLSGQLLTFSKGGTPVKKATSIQNMVMESVNFMLKGSNVKCVFSIPDRLFQVEIDEGQISQVIYNLVLNAVQAMPAGGTLRVSCENSLLPVDYTGPSRKLSECVKISVADEGIGIPESIIGKIFDPYFTTKDKDSVKGTGLGLSTCYSIVKKHGGMIEVKSKVNEGSVFNVYLPASTTENVNDTPVQEVKIVKGAGRVLVMDDEPMVRSIMGDILKRLGYETAFASNGSEAMEMYNEAYHNDVPFDVVIMDLTIPGGMGGKDTMEKLYRQYPNVKAIVSSGYSNDPVMSDYKLYGFKGVVKKPVRINELSAMLYSVMHSSDR